MNTLTKAVAITLLCLLAPAFTGFYAQPPRAYEREAEKKFEAKDYYTAMGYYAILLQLQPESADHAFHFAEAARQFGAFEPAAKYYEKTLASPEADLYPTAQYELAEVRKTLGQYDVALRLFQQYAARADADPVLRKHAESEITQCEWAMERVTTPDNSLGIERLPEEPNTVNSEFAPARAGDTLYYSSQRYDSWGDQHVPARPIVRVMQQVGNEPPVETHFNHPTRHTMQTAISPDGSLMVIALADYVGETDLRAELWLSKKQPNGRWGRVEKLPESINKPGFTATQPNVVKGENGGYELYYSSDAPGGQGGLDLWRARFSATGKFAPPDNLAVLNTPENEATPFFDAKTSTLYFSTTGYNSLGGYDVYKSALKKNVWQTPEHLPVPINSSYNDAYYVQMADDTAMFSSNRPGSMQIDTSACCYDLYKVTPLPISLETFAFSKKTGEPLNEVLFSLAEMPADQPPLTRFVPDENHTEFAVTRQKKYRIIADKEGYFPDTVWVETYPIPDTRKFLENLYLRPQVALAVRTFDKRDNSPLTDVYIRLYEIPGVVDAETSTGNTNESRLRTDFRKQYTIIATKEGWSSDTTTVTEAEMDAAKPGELIVKKLFLAPADMSMFLPLTLYFDNDHPDPRTRNTTTQKSYAETIDEYMARRAAFVNNYTAGLSGAEKAQATERLNRFFDEEVKGGYVKLETFVDNLELFLKSGSTLEIMIKAFASPLASNGYNLDLSKRRIVSVENFMRRYKGGVFAPFVKTGQLKVTTVPYGESASAQGVSDNPKDKRQSIFSVEASRERRAEILEVRMFKN